MRPERFAGLGGGFDGQRTTDMPVDSATRHASGFTFDGSPFLDDEVPALRVVGDARRIAGGRPIYPLNLPTGSFRRYRIVKAAPQTW